MNCLVIYMFMGLLFNTEDIKKDIVQMPQRNEMVSLYSTALVFFRKNEEYKLDTMHKLIKHESNSNNEKCV